MPLAVFSISLDFGNLLFLGSILIFLSVFVSRIGFRIGVPSLILFLVLGLLAGADGLGLKFENYRLAEFIGHSALSLIIFNGGLQTSLKGSLNVLKPAASLSFVGLAVTVILTGGFIFLVARYVVGAVWTSVLACLLLAVILSSTDAHTVATMLHTKRLHLREDIMPILKAESGNTDPISYILTIALVEDISLLQYSSSFTWGLAAYGLWKLLLDLTIGLAVGIAAGYAARYLLTRNRFPYAMYYIILMSVCFFTGGLSEYVHGCGLLSLYVAALIIGDTPALPHKKDSLRFFDGISYLMQLLMFLMLGLLARPSQLAKVAVPALVIALFLMFVARPAGVIVSLTPFKNISPKAKLLISWAGLKGATPILCAICPFVAGIRGGQDLFNIVFCVTMLSLILQGSTFTGFAKKLDLVYDEGPKTHTFGLDVPEEMGMMRDHIVSEEELKGGDTLRDMHLPHGIRVVMVRRDGKFLVPHGSMKLLPGDNLLIIVGDSDD